MSDETVSTERLFGTVGADRLYFDIHRCYEVAIEPWVEWDDDMRPCVEIEEWTTHPPQYNLPDPDTLIGWVAEAGALEADEDWWEEADDLRGDVEVAEAAQSLIDLMASKITYRMAAEHEASHWITFDDDGFPLLNGKPFEGYPSVKPSTPSGAVRDSIVRKLPSPSESRDASSPCTPESEAQQ